MNLAQSRQAQPIQGMRFQNGYQGPERTPFLLIRPEGTPPAVRTGSLFSGATVCAHFEVRGLHRITKEQSLLAPPEATGWSWTKKAGTKFGLLDAKARLVAAFDLQTAFDRAWHHQATLTGRILVYIGDDLVPENGKPVPVQLMEAQAAGSLVAGIVTKG
ncbi:hypothetical protein ABH924_004338 [Arthrobacter sp. GAS37]|uniref:hypothetical protein n=1 Tax=Arthrobacter sp. GAS37 TaxID=3156261 RepID=UPI003836DAB9